MSMIDYDARPVTPQVLLIGHRASSVGYSIRDFLSRNGVPYEWVEVDDSEHVAALLSVEETDPAQLPVCILPSGIRLAPATLEAVAEGLGMVSAPTLSEYDLTIVGAGPAGLAAAVYAASEGLRAVAIESVAPGGQAGTTSMIENYLGFPQGISGSELATRATAQARRFGAEVLLAGVFLTSPRTALVSLPRCLTVPACAHGPCSLLPGSTGAVLRCRESMNSWDPASTTAPARVKR